MPVHDWTRVIAGTFHDFHHEWITTIKHTLNSGLLPSEYYAMAEQITGGLGPDVVALGNTESLSADDDDAGEGMGTPGDGGLAIAMPRTRFTARAEVDIYAEKRSRVVIRHRSGDDVAAVIEIVSPGNKSTRYALRSFVEKALELLRAGIHLLIIDVIPAGSRDPQGIHGAIWENIDEEDQPFSLPPGEPLTMVAYTGGLERQAFIEPVAVGKPLPDMPLFLRPPRHVMVPLEATYQAALAGVPERWRREL
ncbi:MAG: DUF4058 family protein [Planctomycetaceae bacterium]